MQLFSWLHKRMTGAPLTRHAPARKPTLRFRPHLESLEHRDVPSTLTVTSPYGLPSAIGAAANGDTIVFAPSLNGQSIQLDGELKITKNLNIQGPGAGLLAIRPAAFSGDIAYPRIFEVGANVTLTVSGLTLEDGGGTAYGYSSGNSDFTSYPDDDEGGAILNFGTLTVSGCNLSGNSVSPIATYATYGGAIFNTGTLTVTGSTLSGNSACFTSESNCSGRGGAIYNTGSATINNCTLTGNIAGYGYSVGQGGAIYNEGPLTVSGCTISNNTATYWGGGIVTGTSSATTVALTNDTIQSNTATTTAGVAGGGEGGGLLIGYTSTVTLTNVTVKSNTATNSGGGIYIESGATVYLDAFTLANVINNSAQHHRNIDGSYLKS
jgi:predicted outer membrane repeat protein